jgi:hypothetical protein
MGRAQGKVQASAVLGTRRGARLSSDAFSNGGLGLSENKTPTEVRLQSVVQWFLKSPSSGYLASDISSQAQTNAYDGFRWNKAKRKACIRDLQILVEEGVCFESSDAGEPNAKYSVILYKEWPLEAQQKYATLIEEQQRWVRENSKGILRRR